MPAAVVPLQPGLSRYAALAAALRARIVAGEWPPGSALPAEDRLAAEHGVALGTLRRALELSRRRGLIEPSPGARHLRARGPGGSTLLRFFRFARRHGCRPRGSRRAAPRTPTPRSRGGSALARGEPVLRLQRVRAIDGAPCLVEDLWLPLPRSTRSCTDRPTTGATCSIRCTRRAAGCTCTAPSTRSASSRSAPRTHGCSGSAPRHPCACVERVAYDLAGRALEFRRTRGDAHAFRYTPMTLT